MKNIDIYIDIDMASPENIDIGKDILENIYININIDKGILQNIDIVKYCIDKDLAYRTPLVTVERRQHSENLLEMLTHLEIGTDVQCMYKGKKNLTFLVGK